MKVLLTGGTGYIGSHTAVELLARDFEVVLLDNLSNSKAGVVSRIEQITGREARFYQEDLLNRPAVEAIFRREKVDAVIHFAGLKAVGESVAEPLRYYHVNLSASINLCHAMLATDVKNLVFSSSATVYGAPEAASSTEHLPNLSEECPTTDAANPYGRTKLFIERILQDVVAANPSLDVALLRYFNPAGAHESAVIGEDPSGTPGNLIPFLTGVAAGKIDELVIFGDDYPTPDGTCIRDYIHVQDLALGHIAALNKLNSKLNSRLNNNGGVLTCNLGTGTGHSVLDVISTFERATNQQVRHSVGARREGDVAISVADPSRASTLLNWQAEKTLIDICRDAWQWQQHALDAPES